MGNWWQHLLIPEYCPDLESAAMAVVGQVDLWSYNNSVENVPERGVSVTPDFYICNLSMSAARKVTTAMPETTVSVTKSMTTNSMVEKTSKHFL